MRLGRVALVWAVAASSLALFATGASAFRHFGHFRYHGLHGRCHIGIDVVPRHITAGEPVVIFGRLSCRDGVAANRVVKLFHHLRGEPGFTFVQSTTTDARGFYQFQGADGTVDTNRIWYVRAHGAQSPVRSIQVAAQVTLNGPPEGTQILTGAPNAVTFTGTVNPADVGARVILQRQNALTGNDWRSIDYRRVQPGGTFSIAHTFIVPGEANIRVLVRSQGRNVPSTSNVLAYEISQAQNPELTIAASANPIVYGQSVTISGILAGGVSQPVILLARTAHQQGFAPVAQSTTDATGNYAFPAQSPVNSTLYKVQGAGKTSAILYEGVKDVLTAQVSSTSVQAGQPLTFSGSVAPSHPGHIIYLERQDAADHQFHIVHVAVVNPDSTFAIAYTPYSVGAQVYRVHIPGGPENGGAISQLFTVQVTPAPAAALTPEAPGNSSQPAEGSTSPSGRETEGEGSLGQEGLGEGEPHHRGHRH